MASKGEAEGAWITLNWQKPVTADRIWLFDRPNPQDQVKAVKIEFDDGAAYHITAPLVNSANMGLEIKFDRRKLKSIKVIILKAGKGCKNTGLSEIAVFDGSLY